MENHLNIISFDVPFPPDYGGVMDVFYKITALKKAGVKVHLHCFEYGRERAEEMDEICETVHYYKRNGFWEGNFSLLPYIVFSRVSDELTKNLLANDYPVLFEGLHTCYLLGDERFASRKKVYRESNIEHEYYRNLFRSERTISKRIFFLTESIRLKMFEPKIRNASLALVVSESDRDYFRKEFPLLQTEYLPSFHPNESVYFSEKKLPFVLFHGNLSVSENARAAEFLVQKIFRGSKQHLVIAGKNPPESLITLCRRISNIEILANPEEQKLMEIIRKAQVNLLYTERPAGLKLKLLNVLFNGGHCVANDAMLEGTALMDVCETANDPEQIAAKIEALMDRNFSEEEKVRREKFLLPRYSNERNAEKLMQLVFQTQRGADARP